MDTILPNGSSTRDEGVSIVICCHNSAARLPETLKHVAAQEISTKIRWEVLVIDNASADHTAETAAALWPQVTAAPLRVISEPQLGLSFARQRGLAEARYEFVSFIDDDNWICERWVELVYNLMKSHPEVGICGGSSEAVCEIPPPAWWDQCSMMLAISPPDWQGGDITETGRTIWGAGMTVRKSAILTLQQQGFQPLLTGRKGSSLVACEDIELCLAFRLAGWRLWYAPELRLKHYMPAGRLNWRYVRRLYRGAGTSSIGCDPYHVFLNQASRGTGRTPEPTWLRQLAWAIKGLLRQPVLLARAICSNAEGRPEVLQTDVVIGRLLALLKSRQAYVRSIEQLRQARWRQAARPGQPRVKDEIPINVEENTR